MSDPSGRRVAQAFAELRRDPMVEELIAACGDTECHLVGGALRDRALGVATQDLDAVVAGRGREIAAELAASLPARLVELGGKDFAAYRLIAGRGQGGGVLDLWDRQSTSLHDDLARRDFTVNSFALEPRGGAVVDPFGGLADLEGRILRATTRRSFDGDPLRALRLVRLLLRLPGFTAEPETLALARRAAPRLPEVAAERIRDELWLTLSHPAADRGLRALAALDLYPGLWLGHPRGPARGPSGATAGPPATGRATADQGTAGPAADAAVERAAIELAALPGCAAELEGCLVDGSPVIDLPSARFAATFRHLPAGAAAHDSHGPLAALAGMQEAGYVTGRQAADIAPLLAEPPELPDTELGRRRFLNRHGRRWATAACSFGGAAAAAGAAALDRWRRAAGPLCDLARREGPTLYAPPRLLTGEDVQRRLGIPPGPEVGRALDALAAAQVDGAVSTREDAARFLRDWRRRRAE
jgi:poly(A) polymerase